MMKAIHNTKQILKIRGAPAAIVFPILTISDISTLKLRQAETSVCAPPNRPKFGRILA